MRNVFYFSKKVRLFSQNDVLFLFYFLINPAGTTAEASVFSPVSFAREAHSGVSKGEMWFSGGTVGFLGFFEYVKKKR